MDLIGLFTAKGCCQDLPLKKGWRELDKAQPIEPVPDSLLHFMTYCFSLRKLMRFLVVELLIWCYDNVSDESVLLS